MFGDALGADEEVGEPVGCNVGLTIKFAFGRIKVQRWVSMAKRVHIRE